MDGLITIPKVARIDPSIVARHKHQPLVDDVGIKLDGSGSRLNILFTTALGDVIGHFVVQMAELSTTYVLASCGACDVDFVPSFRASDILSYTIIDGENLTSPLGQKYDAMIHCAKGVLLSLFAPNLSDALYCTMAQQIHFTVLNIDSLELGKHDQFPSKSFNEMEVTFPFFRTIDASGGRICQFLGLTTEFESVGFNGRFGVTIHYLCAYIDIAGSLFYELLLRKLYPRIILIYSNSCLGEIAKEAMICPLISIQFTLDGCNGCRIENGKSCQNEWPQLIEGRISNCPTLAAAPSSKPPFSS